MTSRDKMGAVVMITLFAVLFGVLYWTFSRPAKTSGSFENNVIIDQRVKNLNR